MANREAVITPQRCSLGFASAVFAYQVVWTGMADTDIGIYPPTGPTSTDLIPWLDRTFQVEGTFGVGGTLVIEGSNDGTNWEVLTNPQGSALSFTAAGLQQVIEVVMQMRPRVTGGDGTTSLNVSSLYRRTTMAGAAV